MTVLAFVVGVVLLFGAVLAWEAGTTVRSLALRPAGLVTWFVSGNWPAKAGAALLVMGTGALLRYLMLTIELPPGVKLSSGVGVAVVLGAGSAALAHQARRRAVHLALGGAALGVAYLTAYSAYGFFGYVNELQALAALFVVACVATAFAITERAVSIALLGMLGAFLAPAFALPGSDPTSIFGYYLGASALVLLMVWRRGWRPLIHLSFLFTLAGGIFFGWTRNYYSPEFYSQMQPMLLLSIALHLFMPFAERADVTHGKTESVWAHRFDLGYFLLLPLAALALTLTIAPELRPEGAAGLAALALLWVVAGALQHWRWREGASRYGVVGAIFAGLAMLLWLDNLPYFLLGAVVSCMLLALGTRLRIPDSLDGMLGAIALACSAGYLLQVLFDPPVGVPVLNAVAFLDTVLVIALTVAGIQLHRRRSRMSAVFLTLAVAWTLVSGSRELSRLNLLQLNQLAQLGFVVLMFASAVYSMVLWRHPPKLWILRLLLVGLFFLGFFSASGFSTGVVILLLFVGQVVFSLLAVVAQEHGQDGERAAGEARSALPLLALPWAVAFSHQLPVYNISLVMTVLVCSALAASLQAQFLNRSGRVWPNPLSPAGFVLFAFALFYQTLFHVDRNVWAMAFELIALIYLLQTVHFLGATEDQDHSAFQLAGLLAVLSVALAMFLRLFGPDRVMTILDINGVLLPAVVSLLLAGLGGAAAWWSTRVSSRRFWVAGNMLLAAAALKLVLLDFGSLGQLGNILAMMAAGGVFLLVAWLVPIPPKEEAGAPEHSDSLQHPSARAQSDASRPDSAGDFMPTEPGIPSGSDEGMSHAPLSASTTADWGGMRAKAAPSQGSAGWIWLAVGLALVLWVYNSTHHRATVRAANAAQRTAPGSSDAASIAAQAAAQAASQVDPEPSSSALDAPKNRAVATASQTITDTCSRFAAALPVRARVYAASSAGGRPLGYRVEPGNREMTAFDVRVDEPHQDVVVVLGAYEPALWQIRLSRFTRLAGVIVSGYHEGRVVGLTDDIPVLQTYRDQPAPCGYFYPAGNHGFAPQEFVSHAIGRSVDAVFVPTNGRVDIGMGSSPEPAFASPNPTPLDLLRPREAPLQGNAGLALLIRDGKLRAAQPGELEAWLRNYRAVHGLALKKLSSPLTGTAGFSVYVVLKPLELPLQLTGLNVFIYPAGIAVPPGPMNVTLLSTDPLRCTGLLCDRG